MDPLLEYLARADTEASGELIPPHVVDAIRDALPPSVVIGKHVQLRKAGRELQGLSPFGKERTPSFFVNDEKRRWFDFSSNQNGDVFQFVMAFEGVAFPEAVRRCGEMCGIIIMPDRKTMAPMSAEDMARLAAEREERRRLEEAERRESERKASNMAKGIIRESVAFSMGDGSPPARFLESRGLILPAGASPRALRYSPQCPFRGDDGELVFHHALIGVYRDIHDDRVTSIGRRPLSADGRSLKKPVSLGPTGGSAIKFTAHEDISHGLHVAESVTSAIGAAMLGLAPIWALAGKGGISSLPVLAGVDHLTICADKDEDGGGQNAANTCFDRWKEAGREVKIVLPDVAGEDMADIASRAVSR
jgi:hypothetical protein